MGLELFIILLSYNVHEISSDDACSFMVVIYTISLFFLVNLVKCLPVFLIFFQNLLVLFIICIVFLFSILCIAAIIFIIYFLCFL